MDLTRDVIYRSYTLNDEDILSSVTGGGATGTGITGCVIDSADIGDVDVVQYTEKRSQQDGMDVGTPYLGMRRIRLSGTVYGLTRALLYDALSDLKAALNPVLAAREEPLDYGYRPLYFSVPTNDIADYPAGAIDLMVKAMPRSFSYQVQRRAHGGEDSDSLAIAWQATLICKDPTIYGQDYVDLTHATQTRKTGATIEADDNLVTKASHGLSAGDRVRFTTLTGGTGLATTTTYWVIAGGLTSSAFAVSTTSGGSAVDVTQDYTDASFVKSTTLSGTLTNRGNYLCPVNALWVVGAYSGTISGTIGDSTFTISVPASTGARTIRFKGEDKVLTVEEDSVEVPRMDLITFTNDTTWPLIDPGDSAYSITVHGCVLDTGSHVWFYERHA